MPGKTNNPIVVAYDGSDGARAAIDRCAELVSPRPVIVISVWSSLASAARAGMVAVPADVAHEACEKLDRGAEQRAAALAEEGAERLRQLGMEATAIAVCGEWNTWTSIVDAAEEHDAALVVVGSRGLSGVKSALLGSVSNAILHHCSRPVLVVNPVETTAAGPG